MLFLGLALMVSGCGDKSSGPGPGDITINETLRAEADSLSVPAWALLGENVEVRVVGVAGPTLCYSLESVDVDSADHAFTLRPVSRHIERVGIACATALAQYDTTLLFQPSEAGTWIFMVEASDDTLTDSTLVVITEVSPVTIDSVILASGTVLESGIPIRLVGEAESSPDYRLASIDLETEGRSLTLHPLAGPCGLPGLPCETTTPAFDTTLVYHPATAGTWTISVVADNGTFVRTTEVVESDTSTAWIYTLSVPAITDLSGGIGVQITGVIGNQDCRHLAEIGIELSDRTYTLRPLTDYRDEFDHPCQSEWAYFDTTFVLYPPEHGPWWIDVMGENGIFADSVKVVQ
jgi:hypothetical protein